jgi:hypothetical protein
MICFSREFCSKIALQAPWIQSSTTTNLSICLKNAKAASSAASQIEAISRNSK